MIWRERLRRAAVARYGSLTAASVALGFGESSLAKWCRGAAAPSPDTIAILTAAFRGIDIPYPKPRRLSAERRPWVMKLRMHVLQRFGSAERAAVALGFEPSTVSRWVRGAARPKDEAADKLEAEFGPLGLPRDSDGRKLDAHLARLSARQAELFAATGVMRTYTLEEVGGGIRSRERMRQIETVAVAKLLRGLLMALPQFFAEHVTDAQRRALLRENLNDLARAGRFLKTIQGTEKRIA